MSRKLGKWVSGMATRLNLVLLMFLVSCGPSQEEIREKRCLDLREEMSRISRPGITWCAIVPRDKNRCRCEDLRLLKKEMEK